MSNLIYYTVLNSDSFLLMRNVKNCKLFVQSYAKRHISAYSL